MSVQRQSLGLGSHRAASHSQFCPVALFTRPEDATSLLCSSTSSVCKIDPAVPVGGRGLQTATLTDCEAGTRSRAGVQSGPQDKDCRPHVTDGETESEGVEATPSMAGQDLNSGLPGFEARD